VELVRRIEDVKVALRHRTTGCTDGFNK
jgi:hypothetical protein